MIVIDPRLRFSQCHHVLTIDDIREELIRQLASGEVRGAEIARCLRIAPSRVTEMKKREREVQPHEMQALARMLGMHTAGGQHATRPPEVELPSAGELGEMLVLVAPFVSLAREREGGLQEIGEVLREALAHRIANPAQPLDRTLGALDMLLKRLAVDRPEPSVS